MRRLAIRSPMFVTLGLATGLAQGCSGEATAPPRSAEEPATVTLAAPPKPPLPPREMAVTSGVFAIALGDRPADDPIFSRIDLAADARTARCLDDAHEAARSTFVGRMSADGKLTIVGPRSGDAPAEFDDCIAKILEQTPGVLKATPAALRVDVRVRLPDAPCDGPYCEPAPGDPEVSAAGGKWGDEIGEAFGAGGLGLSGMGEGSAGRGEGIGLGSIGTLGHGAGTGTGQSFGNSGGRLGGAHRAKPPSVKMGATSVSGRLPPEVIQRIVRQNFGRFRICYETALKKTPDLEGLVSVFFQINRDGSVSKVASNKASDLPDKGVVACVLKAFDGLSFPQPEGGVVTVTYPIRFSPGTEDKPPTVAGKRLHELTGADVASALGEKGWKTSVVSSTGADGKTAFVVFAEKEGAIGFVTRQAGESPKRHELSVRGDGFTVVGGSLTRQPASGLRDIVQD